MELVVKSNEEIQVNFAEISIYILNKDAYILVVVDKWSQFPMAKVVRNTIADLIKKIMQR